LRSRPGDGPLFLSLNREASRECGRCQQSRATLTSPDSAPGFLHFTRIGELGKRAANRRRRSAQEVARLIHGELLAGGEKLEQLAEALTAFQRTESGKWR
jgi:hypothetical protein